MLAGHFFKKQLEWPSYTSFTVLCPEKSNIFHFLLSWVVQHIPELVIIACLRTKLRHVSFWQHFQFISFWINRHCAKANSGSLLQIWTVWLLSMPCKVLLCRAAHRKKLKQLRTSILLAIQALWKLHAFDKGHQVAIERILQTPSVYWKILDIRYWRDPRDIRSLLKGSSRHQVSIEGIFGTPGICQLKEFPDTWSLLKGSSRHPSLEKLEMGSYG